MTTQEAREKWLSATPKMTANELKEGYLNSNPEGHFFDKKTMEFFGDTMSNFEVEVRGSCYLLHRKKPVKMGSTCSFKFTKGFDYKGAYDS